MAHFRNNTCESCAHYKGEYFMDGPAICECRNVIVWPANKGCEHYKFLPVIGRGYSRPEEGDE